MDTEVSVAQPNQVENLSQKPMKNLDENCIVVEAKENVIEIPSPSTVAAANGAASLGPITPDSNRESGEVILDFASPLTLVSSPQKAEFFHSHPNNDSPRTPTGAVFDPFAPGPDELILAPHCKKYVDKSRRNVTRQLNFGSSVNIFQGGNCETDPETILDDEILLETVYDTLLEAIVSKQTEGLLPGTLRLDPCSNGFKTPDSATCLSGIVETCPGAPMKPPRSSRNIDLGICRKLEF